MRRQRIALIVIAITAAGLLFGAWGFALPTASTYVNVKTRGAKGDGVTDDTQILKQVLSGNVGFIYFPNGTYLVRDRLLASYGGTTRCRTVHGESRTGVVIKLADNCAGFQDTLSPKAVLSFEDGFPDQNFYVYAEYLTIDVGRGNPGAVGLVYQAANIGAASNLTIRSSDPDRKGAIGLGLTYGNNGPAVIRNLDVEGFDYGIKALSSLHIMTLDKINLRNQRRAGVLNTGGLPLAIRNLQSYNSVPVFKGRFSLVLVDSKLEGPASTASAIHIDAGAVLLRRVIISNYLHSVSRIIPLTDEKNITEWLSSDPLTLFPPLDPRLFDLPIQDIPDPPYENPSLWVNSASQGGNDEGIQKAIDAGATTIFIATPHTIDNTIIVRNKVKRIICLSVNKLLNASGDVSAGRKYMFDIQAGTADTVVIERMEIQDCPKSFLHSSTRALVLKDMGTWTYENTVRGGRLFIDDVSLVGMKLLGQNVWMRQINPERNNHPKILNDGGKVWMLGIKTEHEGTVARTINRGRTEILGGSIYPSLAIPFGQACFESVEAHLSAGIILSRVFSDTNGFYRTYVRETHKGQMLEQKQVCSFYCGASDGTVGISAGYQRRRPERAGYRIDGKRLIGGFPVSGKSAIRVIDPAGRTVVSGDASRGLDLSKVGRGVFFVEAGKGTIRKVGVVE